MANATSEFLLTHVEVYKLMNIKLNFDEDVILSSKIFKDSMKKSLDTAKKASERAPGIRMKSSDSQSVCQSVAASCSAATRNAVARRSILKNCFTS